MSQENLNIPDLNAMMGAFTHSSEDEKIIVKAEDLPLEGSGIDYSEHYFEPQVGKSYTLKFITNPFGDKLTHRKIYKHLPDPKRKGKTFQTVSSGSAKTCKTLEAFFELHNLKKEGNGLATQKLDEFMGVTNQAVALVQVIDSPDAKEIGIFRMFTISTYGPNPTIANMIELKVNPTVAMIKKGFVKEDIFNIFESSTLLLECEESEYTGGQKGRDYAKSQWSPSKSGAFIDWTNEAGVEQHHEFSKSDLDENGSIKPEVIPAFKALMIELSNPKLSIHNYFAYKQIGDPKNTEDTEKYLKDVQEKVDEIIPVILKANSIAEIKNYGVAIPEAENKPKDSAQMIGGNKAEDILKNSIPELGNSILNESNESEAKPEAPATNDLVADILKGK